MRLNWKLLNLASSYEHFSSLRYHHLHWIMGVLPFRSFVLWFPYGESFKIQCSCIYLENIHGIKTLILSLKLGNSV